MARYNSLFACSLGGATFQLSDYSYKEDPIVEDGKGQTGVKVSIAGEGFVEAGDVATFEANLGAAVGALQVRGRDFLIVGPGGNFEIGLLAAACVDGGPFVGFEILPQSSGVMMKKNLRFTVNGTTKPKGDNDDPNNSYKLRVVTGPDDLSRVTVSGDLKGEGAAAFFNTNVLPKFDAIYVLKSWVPTVTYEGNATDDTATYTLDYKELAKSLPTGVGGNAVDGSATDNTDRDEQMRMVRTISYDFLCAGDPMALRDFMLATLGAPAFRERYEISMFDQVRIKGEIQLLQGGNGNALMNWTRNLATNELSTNTFDAFPIPGASPIYVKKPQRGFVYVDSGTAICNGVFLKKPQPLYPIFGEADEGGYSSLNEVEKQTTWKYTYLLDTPIEDPSIHFKAMARPDKPVFFNPPLP